MKKITPAIAAVILVLTLSACSHSSSTVGYTQENRASGEIATHYEQVQPPYQPTGRSQYRDNLTYAEAVQVLGLNTTTFFFLNGRNDPYFWCPSKGGMVPSTAQSTNPQFIEPDPNSSTGSVIISNMDPNGVYPPPNSQGTYVRCTDSKGRDYLVDAEPDVTQISAPATWDYKANDGHGGIVVTGAPVMPVCSVTSRMVKNKDGKDVKELFSICTPPPAVNTVK